MIGMYSRNLGELVKTFADIKEACEYTDTTESYLADAVYGSDHCACGFIWRLIDG